MRDINSFATCCSTTLRKTFMEYIPQKMDVPSDRKHFRRAYATLNSTSLSVLYLRCLSSPAYQKRLEKKRTEGWSIYLQALSRAFSQIDALSVCSRLEKVDLFCIQWITVLYLLRRESRNQDVRSTTTVLKV